MSDEEAASSGEKEPPRQVNVARRIASAVSGSLSGTLIGSLVQVCATMPVRGKAEIIPLSSRCQTTPICVCSTWHVRRVAY